VSDSLLSKDFFNRLSERPFRVSEKAFQSPQKPREGFKS